MRRLTILALSVACLALSSDAGSLRAQAGDERKAPEPIKKGAKSKTKNQIRRLLQNSKLPQAWGLAEKAFKSCKFPQDNDLKAYAAFALSAMQGNRDNEKECLRWFDEAIAAGWENPDSFQYSALVPHRIRRLQKFKENVAKLRVKYDSRRARDVQAALEDALGEDAPTLNLPENLLPEGGYDREKLKGRPSLIIVVRSHHEGFTHSLGEIGDVLASFADSVPTNILFYQYRADDAESIRLTKTYAEEAKIAFPYGIVDRSFVRPLKIDYFPSFFFLDGKGREIYRHPALRDGTPGIMDRALLKIVLSKVKAMAPKPAPT